MEQIIFGSVFPQLWKRAKLEYGAKDQEILNACKFMLDDNNLVTIMRLQNQHQDCEQSELLETFLDVPKKFRDPCHYSLCVEELQQIDQPLNMNPRQFLNALLETIICIQITVNTQTQAGLQQRQKMQDRYEQTYNVSFGADDMLPIFIYVLIHAQLKNAATACAVMEFCCDRSTLNDEYGYYLTCF